MIKFVNAVCDRFDNIKVGTLAGRYYAMDRDNRWDRTEKYCKALYGDKCESFDFVKEKLKESYDAGITDEFIEPSANRHYAGIRSGDSVIITNHRIDRVRQLMQLISEYNTTKCVDIKMKICFAPIGTDSKNFDFVAPINKEVIDKPIGRVIEGYGLSQLRISETEKYAHVTYFLNCGREMPYKLEERVLIPSPKVSTYDLKPEMSAYEMTKTLNSLLIKGEYKFICVNYPNLDMVGHTGDFQAAVKACEVIDDCVRELTEVCVKNEYDMLICSDHGNIEEMLFKSN